MKRQLAQFSLVVTGEVHNPTILNPDFLMVTRIVPAEWRENVTQAITTPPFAVVSYSNGITVTVENEKLQVRDTSSPEKPSESMAVEIAKKYVTTLPHVRYKAVGINFQTNVEASSPGQFLKERFLKPGPWDSNSNPLLAAGLRLVYEITGGGRVVLSLDAGETRSAKSQAKGPIVIASANFHRNCDGYPAEQQVMGHLERVERDWAMYGKLLDNVLSEEG